MADAAPLVVGVVFPVKKLERLQSLLDQETDGVRFVLIDLEAAAPTGSAVSACDIEAAAQRLAARYNPLHAVLHKLAHDMVFARLGDESAATRVQLMQEMARQNPSVRLVDPLDSVQLLTSRSAACERLQAMMEQVKEPTQSFKVPHFRVVQNLEHFEKLVAELDAGRTKLPLICKSVEACGAYKRERERESWRADLGLSGSWLSR